MHKCMVRIAKATGSLFVFVVLGILAFVYYEYVFWVWGPLLVGKNRIRNLHRKKHHRGSLSCNIHLLSSHADLVLIPNSHHRSWTSSYLLGTGIIKQSFHRDFIWEIQKLSVKDIV